MATYWFGYRVTDSAWWCAVGAQAILVPPTGEVRSIQQVKGP